jgi:hypothetical protein
LIEKVGWIPINNYIKNLDLRNYGRTMIIDYTKDIYELNINEELSNFENKYGDLWNGDLNIYKEYDDKNPVEKPDDKTREWFNKYGRIRFIDFISQYEELSEQDKAIPLNKPKEVHHIFPLVYEGNSDLLNLAYVSIFSHDILHENPLENIQKFCFQAFDYLSFLGSCNLYIREFSGLSYLNQKYNLEKHMDNKKMLFRTYEGAIEQEMSNFYEYINNQNKEV